MPSDDQRQLHCTKALSVRSRFMGILLPISADISAAPPRAICRDKVVMAVPRFLAVRRENAYENDLPVFKSTRKSVAFLPFSITLTDWTSSRGYIGDPPLVGSYWRSATDRWPTPGLTFFCRRPR
ncbi:hypothetical protein J6590_055379 [Homalodisca vitripennis]|nr:hypothetical protein J6590_055379 [Homalodisca vitripennis]